MKIKHVALAAALFAAMSAPTAAYADHEYPFCEQSPVDTVGAHVEVGDKVVHVPAVSDLTLCVAVAPIVGQPAPVDVDFARACGLVCFRVVVEDRSWTVASTSVQAYLTYTVDGVPVYVPVAYVPVFVGLDNPNPVCVAVGNPIPECPDNAFVVPIPAL